MVPTVTAAEGEKPNMHSTKHAKAGKHPLSDNTEGQMLGSKFSPWIQI